MASKIRVVATLFIYGSGPVSLEFPDQRADSSLDQVDPKMISEVFISMAAKWCLTA